HVLHETHATRHDPKIFNFLLRLRLTRHHPPPVPLFLFPPLSLPFPPPNSPNRRSNSSHLFKVSNPSPRLTLSLAHSFPLHRKRERESARCFIKARLMVVPSLNCVTDGAPPSSGDFTPLKSTPPPPHTDQLPRSRRASARIQETKQRQEAKQRLEKERLIRKRVQLLDEPEEQQSSAKKPRVYSRRRDGEGSDGVEAKPKAEQQQLPEREREKKDEVERAMDNAARQIALEMPTSDVLPASGLASGKSAYAQVKDTLRTFNKYYLSFVQEEESRCKKRDTAKKSPNSKSPSKSKGPKLKKPGRGVKATKPDTKSTSKRPDLKAVTKMLETNAVMYPKKRIGDLPGIDVGHQFYSRAEMVAIGFHGHWLNGIDYMGMGYQKEYKNYTFPLAVAIVLSGMYEDDLDNADEVTYTGQGGHNLTGDKRQIKDQVMERGNLALKNCVDQSIPVRVIRGHVCKSSYVGKMYTYDGLYRVSRYWAEKGISGFTVFKYALRRLEEQPILTTNQVLYLAYLLLVRSANSHRLVCDDITGGLEDIPIPATNQVDNPPVPPTGFTYLKSIQVAKNVKLPKNTAGCDCRGNCVDPRKCACAKLNGSDFPYVHRDGGRLIEAKDVVFECGPSCGCGPSCVNRTSQRGMKHRLEVFRTPKKGWAVRSWDFIFSGSPVCEYVGVLKKTEDVDTLTGNEYIFDIDCLQTMRGLEGRERRLRDVSLPNGETIPFEESKPDSVPEFCIDACRSGNVARFINHSCTPNLFVQCVLSSHQDIRLARVVLFAADNIPPLQELTYDYGYVLDSVMGPDGKIKRVQCYCGGADCRKRLY
ncbi:unnamed protein product, partial [Linum tenue]